MTDIKTAVGIRQLEKLDWIVADRRKIAEKYNKNFKTISCIRLYVKEQGCQSNFQSYSIYLKPESPISRNDLMQKLLDAGRDSSRRGIMTIHRETAYRNKYGDFSLLISEDLSNNSIVIPLYVPMLNEDIERVISSFTSLVTNK
jgi:perosamine synthetase